MGAIGIAGGRDDDKMGLDLQRAENIEAPNSKDGSGGTRDADGNPGQVGQSRFSINQDGDAGRRDSQVLLLINGGTTGSASALAVSLDGHLETLGIGIALGPAGGLGGPPAIR